MQSTTVNSSSEQSSPSSPRYHDARFACHICLESVCEPVVTQCGHLYCWPCLYRWLEPGLLPGERQSLFPETSTLLSSPVDATRRVCPVCKSPCSVPTLVPLYVRAEPSSPIKSLSNHPDNKTASADDSDANEALETPRGASNAPPEGEESIAAPAEHSPTTSLSAPSTPIARSMFVTDHDANLNSDTTVGSGTNGLRQRLRFRDDSRLQENSNSIVPARPAAHSPNRNLISTSPPQTFYTRGNTGGWASASAHHNRASLSYGLAVSLQQALGGGGGGGGGASTAPGAAGSTHVPPLHQNHRAAVSGGTGGDGAATTTRRQPDPDATEFLSRILLMLGSFVILCLLLF